MSLKEELVQKIAAIEDENLLLLLKADIEYFTKEGKEDITDGLSESELKELQMLANEDAEKDTIRMEEYKKVLKQWYMK
ncbi:MAG: hypothetical protein ACTHJ5_07195 [Ilyomonas sp.]